MIEKKCSLFIWAGSRGSTSKPRIAWDKVCKPKFFGGLNVCNLEVWNDIVLLKSLWAIASKKNRLWI